jgi:multiple sugar transport system ATP-binding protein
MGRILLENVVKEFAGGVRAVDDVSLTIGEGEFMVLVGPSGCGKTTLLRSIGGLEKVTGGRILIGERDVTKLEPADRDLAMVFQNYALYPHMSVADNMGFALKLAGVPRQERDRKVREAAALLDLEQYLERRPKALSGGQRQRVAMGRAIVREPSVFLMDEPLSNLDAKLRVETRANIAALQARLGTTTVYVTHDQVEAMTMGHRVAVLRDGKLQQVGPPRSLYESPANAFVAGFIGSPAMNLRICDLVPGGARFGNIVLPLRRDIVEAAHAQGLERLMVGVRPESFTTSADPQHCLRLQVNVVEELGADAYVYGVLDGDDPLTDKSVVVRFDGRVSPRTGETICLDVNVGAEHAFHPVTGERIG